VDVMLAGATGGGLFRRDQGDDPAQRRPDAASWPFDRTRNGFVLAEGAAMMVLEELDHATARGARIYAEISGYATRCNAYHMTGLKADGREMAEAIRHAMADARCAPTAVDYVNRVQVHPR
jgi:minimal PKS ketosynthase (KS/KS alpha)